MGHEWAHTQFLGQGERLLVVGFGLDDVRGGGVGVDHAKLVQCQRLIPAFLELPGQVERLARMLQGLLAVSRQTTHLAEPCDPTGMMEECACAYTFPDRLLQ